MQQPFDAAMLDLFIQMRAQLGIRWGCNKLGEDIEKCLVIDPKNL